MDVKLRDVFAGDAARRRKPQDNPIVDGVAVLRTAQPHMAGEARRRQGAGQGGQRLAGKRTADADDGDGRAPRRARRGKDRIGRGARRA